MGQRAGLASERAYVWRTLPRGVGRELRAAVVRREGRGLVRAGAIVAGLLITAAGYLNGMVAARRAGIPAGRQQYDLDEDVQPV